MKNSLICTLIISTWSLAFGQAPNWSVDGSLYAHNMNITATLFDNCVQAMEMDDEIGIFLGNDLRGTGKCSNVNNGEGIIFITLYSNVANGEVLTVKFYDASLDQTLDLTDNDITFVSSDVLGNITQPHQFWIDLKPLAVSITNNQGELAYSGDSIGINGLQYQWLKDGVPVNGANSATYTPIESGDYSLQVTAPGYCEETSNIENVFIDVTGIEENSLLRIFPYPVPADNQLNLNFPNTLNDEVSILLFNSLGQEVYMDTKKTLNTSTYTLPTSGLANGVYHLNVIHKDERYRSKISIQHK
ncbi:Por secretion system C-terminal sorting domain-containing protein [Lishizhenia tianjinensis]|uniref:Por secretion system C-terminal sorting domain-containing protein n=2 Tax=Lishizhenia tianjinensis TaxID=477690 RepID=A0A1I7B4W1_9FLAO|nr:Por secretion system C-terminal sorting domain-containing protein [Lishizhenia tianjinensis]